LAELFEWMANNPQKISEWEALGLDGLAQSLKLGDTRDASEIAETLWARLNVLKMQAASAALKSGGANDVKRGVLIDKALAAPDKLVGLNHLSGLYFTQAKAHRKKLYDAKTHDLAKDWIDTHSLDIMEADEAIRASEIYALTESVFNIAVRYAALYRETAA